MSQYKYDFNEIKATANIEHILRHYGLWDSLKSRGDERVGRCMLGKKGHGKKDSFAANVKKKTFQCFSCKKRGSIIDFVRFHEGLTLPESAEKIVQIMEEEPKEKALIKPFSEVIAQRREEQIAFVQEGQSETYGTKPDSSPDAILAQARMIMRERVNTQPIIDNPNDASEIFIHDLGSEESEVFAVLFLDSKLRIIAYERMFYGTVNETYVHVREVAKKALLIGAKRIICGHNHPTASRAPSQNDLKITEKLKGGLDLLDIILEDHMIVGGGEYHSMADNGEI